MDGDPVPLERERSLRDRRMGSSGQREEVIQSVQQST